MRTKRPTRRPAWWTSLNARVPGGLRARRDPAQRSLMPNPDGAPQPQKQGGSDWPETLESHGVQLVILDICEDRDLVEQLRIQAGWQVDYEDADGILFARAA